MSVPEELLQAFVKNPETRTAGSRWRTGWRSTTTRAAPNCYGCTARG